MREDPATAARLIAWFTGSSPCVVVNVTVYRSFVPVGIDMTTSAKRVRAAAVAAVVAATLPALPPSKAEASNDHQDRTCAPGVSLLGFSDVLDKTTFAGMSVASLSALAVTGRSRGLALVDNIGTTPARVYDLDLYTSRRGVSAAVRDVTVLTRPDGTPYNGVDFDGEGMVAEHRGRTILASSEREPSIRRFRLSDGREIASLPVPERFRVAPAGEAEFNHTFESLAATPDHRTLYAGLEGPLAADGDDAQGRHLLRIIRYAGREGGAYTPVAQLAYRSDPDLGLVELVALRGDRLLALERGFTPGVGNTVRVYRVSAAGAPDVSGVASLASLTDPSAWLEKELLVDIVDCPPLDAVAKQPQPNPLLDNIEAMALGRRLPGGRRLLWLLSDDNGLATQTTRLYGLSVRLPRPPLGGDGVSG